VVLEIWPPQTTSLLLVLQAKVDDRDIVKFITVLILPAPHRELLSLVDLVTVDLHGGRDIAGTRLDFIGTKEEHI
jgi:hypothetical protein